MKGLKKLTIKLDIFTHNSASGLILLVERNDNTATLNTPPTNLLDKLIKGFSIEVQPRLQHSTLNTLHSLADNHSLALAHQLLEPLDIGDQISVEVIAVQRRPECVVGGADQLAVEGVELLYGFGEGVGRGVGGEDVRGQES
jgi:hypothetical protein